MTVKCVRFFWGVFAGAGQVHCRVECACELRRVRRVRRVRMHAPALLVVLVVVPTDRYVR